jgi:rhamnogalacturonyl hydrolase YesR
MPNPFKKTPSSTTPQQIDTEREQRVASRDRVDYSYAVFWTKNARLWDAAKREAVAQHLAKLIASTDFDANFYQRTYMVAEVDGAHSGASLLALQKVLEALSDA